MFGLNKMKRQIDELQTEVLKLKDTPREEPKIRIYSTVGEWFPGWRHPSASITHEEAIMIIANHVGLKFEYQEGKPASVTLGKASAQAKNK